MSLVCSVIFIHHAFNANILDKDYAFSDGEILMVDNAVRTHFEPYERHFKEIGFTENTIKKQQGVVREFIDSSQPPLSEVNQEKFNNIKKALSEAK